MGGGGEAPAAGLYHASEPRNRPAPHPVGHPGLPVRRGSAGGRHSARGTPQSGRGWERRSTAAPPRWWGNRTLCKVCQGRSLKQRSLVISPHTCTLAGHREEPCRPSVPHPPPTPGLTPAARRLQVREGVCGGGQLERRSKSEGKAALKVLSEKQEKTACPEEHNPARKACTHSAASLPDICFTEVRVGFQARRQGRGLGTRSPSNTSESQLTCRTTTWRHPRSSWMCWCRQKPSLRLYRPGSHRLPCPTCGPIQSPFRWLLKTKGLSQLRLQASLQPLTQAAPPSLSLSGPRPHVLAHSREQLLRPGNLTKQSRVSCRGMQTDPLTATGRHT